MSALRVSLGVPSSVAIFFATNVRQTRKSEPTLERDIVIFYYYSSPLPSATCYLRLLNSVVYRNMFLLPCPDGKIHFEFPVFEDHSYNTVCNRRGLRALVERPSEHDKFILFRTRTTCHEITGFYRVRRAFFQTTRMFNNNGFVWGIEAAPHLVERGSVIYEGPTLTRGYRTSWSDQTWRQVLNDLVDRVQQKENISELYSSETNRLIGLFKDEQAVDAWRKKCLSCVEDISCPIGRAYKRYAALHPERDMFSAVNYVYNSNIYSKNVLETVPRVYLR